MAFIFRIRRKGKPPSKKWYVRFRDPLTNRVVTHTGYEDKTATEQLAARLVREAARHAEGLGPPPAVNRVDALDDLRAELRQSILDSGGSMKHADLTDQRLRDLFEWCGWKNVRELSPATVVRILAARRDRDGERRDKRQRIRFGLASTNHYLRAVKRFGRWLSRISKGFDPFAELQLMNAEVDRRHPRRSLTVKELAKLLNSTAASNRVFKRMAGVDRASLYHVAAYTGLRSSELARLTLDDFILDSNSPGVCVSAEQKNGKETPLPLHPSLIDVVLDQAKRGNGKLWPAGTWQQQTGEMLRKDLKEAGIPAKTAAGIVDLHALRVTFGTNLARFGVPLVTAQKLLRHSDPRLARPAACPSPADSRPATMPRPARCTRSRTRRGPVLEPCGRRS